MPHHTKKVGIITLGCKVNQYESEAIAEHCAAFGLLPSDADGVCDAYIINTCAVTAEADRKSRQLVRRALSQNPDAYIIVAGCSSQVNPSPIGEIEGVDYVFGNTDKLGAARAAARLIESGKKNPLPEIAVGDIMSASFESMAIGSPGRTRAFVKIEDGCESRCTYCIIPTARGKIRSKPPGDVIREIESLVRGGCREVVLTGIETAAYGRDLENTDLSGLLREIDNINGIVRVRTGSLDPSCLKPAFIETLASMRSAAPHFHLSVQSGSNRILGLMRRKYNTDMLLRSVAQIKSAIPAAQLTADMIVGFPTESEDDFKMSAELIESVGFLSVHVFAYSRRDGTVAASMPGQIPAGIKQRRSSELSAVAANVRRGILDKVTADGTVCEVLFETHDGKYAYGHTESFIETAVLSPVPLDNSLRRTKLTSHNNKICFGELI